MRRKLAIFGFAIAGIVGAASCQTGQTMFGPCTRAADGNPFGTDGRYVLNCVNGKWMPIMTVHEFLALSHGHIITIAPVPTEPTTTTTTTTTTPP